MSAAPLALVTGSSRGIGAAVAERLASAGAQVVVCGRTEESARPTVERIAAAGGTAWPLALDVTDAAAVAAAPGRVAALADGRPLDWLVNNAGLAETAPLLRADDAHYERLLAVNFHGPRRLSAACLPGMLERGSGAIVHVASSAALRGYAYVAGYCASKHALLGWARAAALELKGSGVAMATVCPHYVDSPMLDRSVADVVAKTGKQEAGVREFFQAQNPGGRLVSMDEVAEAVLERLRSGENGAVVELDGGAPRLQLDPRLGAVTGGARA